MAVFNEQEGAMLPGFGEPGSSWNNYLNQQDAIIGTGIGFGGGVGAVFAPSGIDNTGGGGNAPGYIPIVQTPNLPNSDQQFLIRINQRTLNADSAEISNTTPLNGGNSTLYINGENTYKTLDTTVTFTISQILNEGAKTLTIQNQFYNSREKYQIDVIRNPLFAEPVAIQQFFGQGIQINPYDSLIQYSNRQLYTEQNYVQANTNNFVYSNQPGFTIRIAKYIDGNQVSYEDTLDLQLMNLNERNITFALEPIILTPIEDPVIENVLITINVDGPDNSVSLLQTIGTSTEEIILKAGVNEISTQLNSENTLQIQSSNINSYRVSSILLSGELIRATPITAENPDESVFVTLNPDSSYTVNVTSENVRITTDIPLPIVRFLNPSYIDSDSFKIYNKNSNTDIPVALTLENATSVKIFVGDKEFDYDLPTPGNGDLIATIPASAFSTIGTYKIRFVAIKNTDETKLGIITSDLFEPGFTRGEFIEAQISVVDDIWVGIPDISNITYPSVLRGPDYVGTNVDFAISYDSIDTDFVRLYVESKENKYTQLPSNGTHTLNFQELLTLGNVLTNEEDDFITINLLLVPYNISGREVLTGKEETISIQFDKGDLTIPRELAISRIAEGFIAQFDESIFIDETSKYLTHLLHIDNGDTKTITTWVGDDDSLILKLYEPLETSIQPNQQVWISKLQAQPIVETITITGVDTSFCAPLKGPNFSLNPDNGIGFQVFDDLIASGSKVATDIYNAIGEKTTIDTTKLNIQYVSASVYTFENFVHFGSANERVENFYYKIKLLEEYQNKYISLVQSSFPIGYVLTEDAGGDGTPELEGDEILQSENELGIQYEVPQVIPAPFAQIEAQKVAQKITNLINSFDGFENFLFKSEDILAYPKQDFFDYTTSLTYRVIKPSTSNDSKSWYANAQNLSEYFDKYNSYAIKNNLPEYIFEDYQNADFLLFCDMIGQHFDILWCYINGLKTLKRVEHKQELGLPNQLVSYLLESMGWNTKKAFNSQFLWEYLFGTTKEGAQKYGKTLEDANYEVWRRILNNLPYLLKHKGTGRALKAVMACYGVPQSMLTIMEFGGPQDPTKGGSTKFTFDDRTAAINLQNGAGVKIPWKYDNDINSYPNAVEFRIKPSKHPAPSYTIISGSEWQLDVVASTGSFATLKLNFGGDASATTYIEEPFISASVSTYYYDTASYSPYVYGVDLFTSSLGFPISLEDYSNVIINRYNYGGSTSLYEVWWATGNGERITTFVSMSVLTDDTQWETGSFLHVGSDNFSGNIDEFRLWTVPLQKSKFENHTLFPDAINGNSYTASTSDLLFRLDFEYPKDRTKTENNGIINVAISDNYGEPYGYSYNMQSASVYPYQYTPYDRTVTATVPSLGFNYSNKIRFESASLVTDLSYKVRATKKSFDRAPIDSSRLGLFFSPIKELNMDILKSFGDFNIDNYIGDPRDEYKETYKELDNLRHYYFERLDRNIYEYIQLVRYIDKSLFDVLSDLAPARAKISKGLLIEPHFLERSKTRWDKPESSKNNFDSTVEIHDNDRVISEYNVENATLDVYDEVDFDSTFNSNESEIDANEVINLESLSPTYGGTLEKFINEDLEASAPFYESTIYTPSGSTLTTTIDIFKSEVIGLEKDSLANLGYGLYGKNGMIVYRTWDGVFGNTETTGSRKFAYVVREQKTKKINTQISGWPTNGSQPGDPVKYGYIPTTYDAYRISILPTGSISISGEIVEVTPLNGYLKTHYKFVNNLSEGMQRSYWKGSQQTSATTPDGLDPVETFTTNPNILRVARTGRGSGEPILEVD